MVWKYVGAAMCGRFHTIGLAWAAAGAGTSPAPPAARASATSSSVLHAKVFMRPPPVRAAVPAAGSERLHELADEAGQGGVRLAPLIVRSLAALAMRHYGQREIRAVLQLGL